MQISSSVSTNDSPIAGALEERPGKPVRIRLQPTMLRLQPTGLSTYMVWQDVHWTIECENLEETRAFREALKAFFWQLEMVGPDQVRDRLSSLVPSGT